MNNLILGDCLKEMKNIPNESIDAIITDPPYGVLKGHKIETNIDIEKFMQEAFRVIKDDSCLVFFGLMPTITDWYLEAVKAGFKYKESITWVKRSPSSPFQKVTRQKEEIYIMEKGKAKYNITNERFEDLKMPLYLDGLYTIESLERYIGGLKYHIKHGKSATRKKTEKTNQIKSNDAIYNNMNGESFNAPETMNISNVWSFMPENKVSYGQECFNVKHPTVKPLAIMERLIELVTFDNQTIFDGYMGSGTTGVACKNLNRHFIGIEIYPEYFEIAKNRIENVNKTLL